MVGFLKKEDQRNVSHFLTYISLENNRIEKYKQLCNLEEAPKSWIANGMLASRLARDHIFDVEHEG